jgi:hypothetical protein
VLKIRYWTEFLLAGGAFNNAGPEAGKKGKPTFFKKR